MLLIHGLLPLDRAEVVTYLLFGIWTVVVGPAQFIVDNPYGGMAIAIGLLTMFYMLSELFVRQLTSK